MTWADYDLIGSFNAQRYPSIDAERNINCFEYIDQRSKKPKTLIQTSGLINTEVNFPNVSAGAFRAQFVFKDKMYAVISDKIYSINSSLVASELKQINTTSGYVGIDANTFQVIIVDGADGWIIDTTANTVTQITDTSFPATPIDVTYLDGFFIVAHGTTNQFQLSSFNQGLVWGPDNSSFTASATTDRLTIASSDNYQTGVTLTVVANDPGTAFTAADAGDLFTVASTANYPTGIPVRFTGGGLPPPIVIDTNYYIINLSGTTFQVATTYANAIASTPLVLTGNGSGTVFSRLPDPLLEDTTYYAIFVDATHIQLATSYANAIAGTEIDLLSNGGPTNGLVSDGQLQQGEITTHPGTIQACRTLHRRLFLFAENFTEVWENAGLGTNLPFRRNNSLLMEYGTKSLPSVKASFDMMCFLSNDKDGQGAVMAVFGAQPIPISNRALDFQISQYAAAGHVSDASGILIKENGLIFYRLNFTQADHTYVYNVSMSDPTTEDGKRWHEEETLRGNRHLAQTHAFFNGNNYYGNYLTHIMYRVDPNYTLNAAEIIKRTVIGKPITPPEYKRLRVDRFQVDFLQGQDTTQLFSQAFTALATTDIITVASTSNYHIGDEITVSTSGGILPQPLASFTTYFVIVVDATHIRLATTRANAISNTYINITTNGTPINLINIELNLNIQPIAFLSYSKDGGQSYGNRLTGTMGRSGERSSRTVWRKLGTVPRGQGFVPKIEFYNQVPFVLLGASWVFEQMPE